MKLSLTRLITAFGIAATVAACSSDSPVQPETSPLAGLNQTTANDTGNTGTPTGAGPGYFHGTVLGPALPGSGNDSLNTAPRIAGVVVTIYERKLSDGSDAVAVGAAKGSVTTGTDGKFTLPTLPPREYIVTFVPPANSGYHGAYASGPLHQNSSDFPWWIVLAKK